MASKPDLLINFSNQRVDSPKILEVASEPSDTDTQDRVYEMLMD